MKIFNGKTCFALIFVMINSIVYKGYSQIYEDYLNGINNIIPPSPTAASLAKYVDFPVSHYTGKPSVNIPIWVIKSGSISLPISLSYNSDGLKVEEIPGWTGLGWSLNAGGVITRTINGLDDKMPNGYLNWYVPDPADGDLGFAEFFNDYVEDNETVYNVYRGLDDFQPDVFNFNFNGYQGKFIIRKQKDGLREIVQIPKQNLHIKILDENDANFLSWLITTGDGTKYYFQEIESVSSYMTCANSISGLSDIQPVNAAINSWYLSKIVSADNKNTVDFTYLDVQENYHLRSTQKERVIIESTLPDGDEYNEECQTYYNFNTLKIQKIETKSHTITFQPKLEANNLILGREDLFESTGAILDKITIKEKGYENYEKIFQLNTNYYNSSSNGKYDYYNYRLRLDGIDELSFDKSAKKSTSFKYNTKALPPRGSYMQDFWGYYNGKETNTTLIPIITYQDITYSKADRTPDAAASQAGILTEIHYPTGGYTRFEFEPHSYGAIRNRVAIEEAMCVSTKEKRTFDMLINAPDNSSMKFLKVTYDQICRINFSLSQEIGSYKLYIDPVIPNENFKSALPVEQWFDPDPLRAAFSFSTSKQENITLKEGYYLFTMKSDKLFGESDTDNAFLTFNYYFMRENCSEGSLASETGGCRVKKIINDPNDGTKPVVKYFDYSLPYQKLDGEIVNLSSGVLVNDLPNFYQIEKRYIHNGDYIEGYYKHLVLMSNMQTSASTQGSHIGYRNIIIKEESNGYIEERYLSPYQVVDLFKGQFPFPPNSSFDYVRGNLIEREYYNEDGLQLKKEEYKYVYQNKNSTEQVFDIVAGIKQGTSSCVNSGTYNDPNSSLFRTLYTFEFDPYYYYSDYVQLESKKIVNYFENDSSIVQHNYSYNTDYRVLTDEIVNDSKFNHFVSKQYSYPFNFSHISPYSDMVDNYQVNTVIESTNSYEIHDENNNILTSRRVKGLKNTYEKDSYDHVLPKGLLKSNLLTGVYEEVATIDLRDDETGNVLQFQDEKDQIISIYFGYNSLKPIVKAENINYTVLKNAIDFALAHNEINKAGIDELLKEVGELNTIEQRELWDKFNRIIRSETDLKNVNVTSYTYIPLIGVSSITDYNNSSTYYKYDLFGRLSKIVDDDNNLLKQYKYNYKQSQQ